MITADIIFGLYLSTYLSTYLEAAYLSPSKFCTFSWGCLGNFVPETAIQFHKWPFQSISVYKHGFLSAVVHTLSRLKLHNNFHRQEFNGNRNL